MNFTGLYGYRASTLAFIASSSIGPISGWKGYAVRIAVFAVGLGIYLLSSRRKGSRGSQSSLRRRNRRIAALEPDARTRNPSAESPREIIEYDHRAKYDRLLSRDSGESPSSPSSPSSPPSYNGEICPICLGVPKIGVRASCGHLLCAECLASYCDLTIRPAPLPCPLCRAPLNSIALARDFAIPPGPPKIQPDPNAMTITQDWIREYNDRSLVTSVRPLPMTRLTLFVNILILFLIVGLIAARLQIIADI